MSFKYMKEVNKHLLETALARLPEYDPKDLVWDRINEVLVVTEQETHLHQSLDQLPTYEPPELVWDKIQAGLPVEQKPKNRIVRLGRWAAVAAVLVALTWTGLRWSHTNPSADYVSLQYSEEKVASAFLTIDWEADEDAFAMVSAFCKSDNIVCKQPAFKILTEELDELNAAREELKYAMDQYGKDPELIAQLTAIEHERSDILKKIIKKI